MALELEHQNFIRRCKSRNDRGVCLYETCDAPIAELTEVSMLIPPASEFQFLAGICRVHAEQHRNGGVVL